MLYKKIKKLFNHLSRTLSNERGAITFDGVDDSVTCGTADILTENGAVTVSAWINAVDGGGSNRGRILFKDNTGGVTLGFNFQINNLDITSGLEFLIDGTTALNVRTSNNTITFGSVAHVLVTWDGSTTATNVHIYVNGAETGYLLQQDGSVLTDTSVGTIRVGNRGGLARGFNGLITELAVWNRVLTAGEISSLYNSGIFLKSVPMTITSGLQMYLPMNDGVIDQSANLATVSDSSGNNNNGTGNWGANASGLLWSLDPEPGVGSVSGLERWKKRMADGSYGTMEVQRFW